MPGLFRRTPKLAAPALALARELNMRDAAWQLFVRYHDHVFSFTDCTSFALMRAMSLEEAFTFDRGDFATAGLATLV